MMTDHGPFCSGFESTLGWSRRRFLSRFGMGFGLKSDALPISPNEGVFFWGGWGGSLALIDLEARLTVSYVMNRMASNLLGDVRGGGLAMAAYRSLDG